VVNGPTVSWLVPDTNECAPKKTQLVTLAASTAAVRNVRFFNGSKQIALVKRGGAGGLYGATWTRPQLKKGRHTLKAVVTDAKGRTATAERVVRVCS
jgi:hypothetical protein